MSELDLIESSNALERYLTDRGGNLSAATITSHRSRLSTFVGWLADQGIDKLNDLTGRMVEEYQLQRREETGWAHRLTPLKGAACARKSRHHAVEGRIGRVRYFTHNNSERRLLDECEI